MRVVFVLYGGIQWSTDGDFCVSENISTLKNKHFVDMSG
jgi:hypothetical protein